VPGYRALTGFTVDETRARRKASNGFCTQIGNLVRRHGVQDPPQFPRTAARHYLINDEAIAYMHDRALAGPVIARLLEHPARCFANHADWSSHLDGLGISALKVNPDPVLIATEGALWGSIKAHGFLTNTVIVSDDAGQFDVGQHALCWVQYLESEGRDKEVVARSLGAHEYIDSEAVNPAQALQAMGGAKAIIATVTSAEAGVRLLWESLAAT